MIFAFLRDFFYLLKTFLKQNESSLFKSLSFLSDPQSEANTNIQ